MSQPKGVAEAMIKRMIAEVTTLSLVAFKKYGDQAKRQKSHFVIRRRKPCQFNFNLGLNVEGVL